MGHAVYTLSNPREKGTFDADFALHENIEAVAPEIIAKARNMPRLPATNVEFYSGAVYYMLGVPPSFYTAIFIPLAGNPDTLHYRRDTRLVHFENFYRPENSLAGGVAKYDGVRGGLRNRAQLFFGNAD